VSNGVKHAVFLWPILFIVYIDELIVLLKKSGFGCRVGTEFTIKGSEICGIYKTLCPVE